MRAGLVVTAAASVLAMAPGVLPTHHGADPLGSSPMASVGASTLLTDPPAATAVTPGPGSRTVHVSGAGAGFDAVVPGTSVATFTWAPGSGTAQEYLTSANGTTLSRRLQRQPDLALAGATPAVDAVGVQVDPGGRHQTITGFGGALTDSAATLIAASPDRGQILDALFGAGGARFSTVRVPMGATDLEASRFASYDDSPSPDPHLRRFSVAHDDAAIVPLLKQATTRQPDLFLLGAPWSAPAWMKRGGTFDGTCRGDLDHLRSRYRSAYADYFVRFAQAYAHRGLPMSMLSLQNEPQTCRSDYPTMNLGATEEAALAVALRARLDQHGLASTGIMAWDHNWYDEGAPPGAAPTTYPTRVLAASRGSVAAIGYHCYNADGNPAAYATQTTAAPVYLTECSGDDGYPDVAANLVDEVDRDLIGPLRNGAKGSLYWSLALGNDGGPHAGGCSTCRGMIGFDRTTGAWAPNEDYYYWSQLSRYVDPGAVRIDSTDPGRAVHTVAFRNPDGTVVLVVLNGADTESYRGHVVQSATDQSPQLTAWLVGPDGRRRWVADTATYSCLVGHGAPGPNALADAVLDGLPDVTGARAVCGGDRIGSGSMLQRGFDAVSAGGGWTLHLTDASLTLDGGGRAAWTTGVGGDDLLLTADGDLVEQRAGATVWSSGTAGSGGVSLVVGDDGVLRLYDAAGGAVWSSA